jgi:diacylglycerol kinase family enzyme
VVHHAGIKREVSPFLLMISNANQFGYDFSLTPKALVSDGQFELILFKSKTIWSLFKLFLASRFGLKLSKKLLEVIPISDVVIESTSKKFLIQLDGETNLISNQELQIEMHPTGLHVITPS